MTFTDSQLKGNWGEQYIASKLTSRGCFVRHVPEGHDTGVDLYCETTKEGVPFLHFWCQIKTSNRWTGASDRVSFRPTEKHKEYWLKQPVPVFIFLVPDKRDEDNVPFYIQSIIFTLSNGHQVRKIENTADLDYFLDNELPLLTWCWEAKEGKVGPLKTPERGYVYNIPTKIARHFEQNIRPPLVMGLERLTQDILFQDGDSTEILNNREIIPEARRRELVGKVRPYAKALQVLTDEFNLPNYQTHAIIGGYYDMAGDGDTALRYYRQSIQSLDEDSTFRDLVGEEKWNEIYNSIRSCIERLE